jgi:23S rRNA pseudouridine1911/1915/1917 synthase
MNSSYNYDKYIIEILYEDDHIAILNKPSGLLTHRKNSNDVSPNLQESIQLKFDIDDDEELKEGIVHRLDKDTSGIIIITKNKLIKSLLKEKFKIRELKKNYIAYTFGVPQHSNIEIDKNIARQKIHRTKFETSEIEWKECFNKNIKYKKLFWFY